MTEKKVSKIEKIKPFIHLAITGLVELFTNAVCTNVMSHVEGGRFARAGARAGANLVGMMIGDKVGDYVCDNIDEMLEGLDEVKAAIDQAKGETE